MANKQQTIIRKLGFTLIEVLVVIVIIGIASSIVVIKMMNVKDQHDLQILAEQLSDTISLAQEQAMLQPAVLGITIDQHQLIFKKLVEEPTKTLKKWQVINDKLFRSIAIPYPMQLKIHHELVDLTKDSTQPLIILTPSGDITPFNLSLNSSHGPGFVVTAQVNGLITYARAPNQQQ